MRNKTICLTLGILTYTTGHAESYINEYRPNVVFIYADDMGRGMLSHFGQKYIETPNIDRIFEQGTSFEYAYGCTYSAPARASLLTGYNDCRGDKWNIPRGGPYLTVKNYKDLERVEHKIDSARIEPPIGDLLLPQIFKRAGYVTGQFGKLDWGFASTRKQIHEHGWDEYCGYMDHRAAHAFYPHYFLENDSIVWFKGNTAPDWGLGTEEESPAAYKKRWDMTGKAVHAQDIFIDRMVHFIRKHNHEPFFMWHSTNLPHGPVAVKEIYPEIQKIKGLTSIEKEYLTMVKMLDNTVGTVFEELKKNKLLDHTLIIFSADNGHDTYYNVGNRCRNVPSRDKQGKVFDSWDYPFLSKLSGDLFNGNDGMTGKKRDNFEGGVRVPLAIWYPGHIRAGKKLNQVVTNYDWPTTFADLFDIKLPYKKDGESLMPLLTGGKDKLSKERYVFMNSRTGPSVVDSNHWKLRYNTKKKAYRLFYLPNDYNEEYPMNDKRPDIMEKLKKQLAPYPTIGYAPGLTIEVIHEEK